MKRALFILMSIGMYWACKNDKKDPVIVEDPIVKKDSTVNYFEVLPNSMDTFENGEIVLIEAILNSENIMHGYEIFIVNEGDLDTVFKLDEHDHVYEFMIEEEWVNEEEKSSNMELIIVANLSHDSKNNDSLFVNFYCKGL